MFIGASVVRYKVWQRIFDFDTLNFAAKKLKERKWKITYEKNNIQNYQHFWVMYLLMCCARSEMVQCLQIRPVSLKHTSTQQLLINVFVLHSFPMKKFLKLSPSIVPNNAKMFNNKNVKFIFSTAQFSTFQWRLFLNWSGGLCIRFWLLNFRFLIIHRNFWYL